MVCRQLLPCVVLGLVGPGFLAAQQRGKGDGGYGADALQTFAFFDSLDLPAIQDKPFVRVQTGWWVGVGETYENSCLNGVLVGDKGKTFRVLTIDLEVLTFERTKPDVKEHERVSYQALPLKQAVAKRLQQLADLAKEADTWPRSVGHPPLWHDEQTELAFHAWCCRQHGLHEPARKLLEKLLEKQSGTQLVAALTEDVGRVRMWRMVVAFGDASRTWENHLREFETHARLFPDTGHAERVQATIKTLRRMVAAETAEQARRRRSAPGELSKQERIRRLVFDLRTQNGHQWSQPGACDIWNDSREKNSPAHQLASLGFDAVPALIEALADDTLTRSVGYVRDFYFSHHVLRVGDCALSVLQSIAQRSFFDGSYFHETPHHEGKVPSTRQRVLAWWKEVKDKGEKQVLVEATVRGDDSSPRQAALLVSKYPEGAAAALEKGIANAKDDSVRAYLVLLLGELEGEQIAPLLRKHLAAGQGTDVRVAAAVQLWQREPPDAALRKHIVDRLIQEWRRKNLERPGSVGTFLALCGEARAIRALHEHWNEVGSSLLGTLRTGADPIFDWGSTTLPPLEKPSAAWLGAVEALAVECLRNRHGWFGWGGGMSNPRVCDYAAMLLAERWPDRYRFDGDGGNLMRDRQIRRLQNTWRKAHGKPLLPSLDPKPVIEVPATTLEPLLRKLVFGGAADERREARGAISAMGLGALSGLRRQIQALAERRKQTPRPKDPPGRQELEELSRRLGGLVREVSRTEGSAAIPPDLTASLESWRRKPLDPDRLRSLLIDFLKNPPPGVQGLGLEIERADGDVGLQVRVIVKPVTGKAPESWTTVSRTATVAAGGENLHNISGAGTIGSNTDADAMVRFRDAVRKALREFPDTAAVSISVSMDLD